jgi:multiple sugar transport system substrate-binding protein
VRFRDLRRNWIAVSGAVTLLAALAGCGSGSADGSVTITFLNPHAGAYDAVIAQFEQRNPGIKVEQQSVPFDQLVSQTQARLASGDTSIDVLSVDPPRLAGMVAQGFLTDESSHQAQLDTAASAVGISSVTVHGRPYAYPLWTSDNFLLYNKDILAKAGVATPGATDADRLTWEQVLDAARRAVGSGAARYGFGIEQIDRYYALQPMLLSMGAGSGLQGDENLTPAVNTPQWRQFGRWYADLHNSGLAPRGISPEQMPALFSSGQVAFLVSGPSSLGKFAKSGLAGHWGIAPLPHFTNEPVVTPTDSWAVGISALSEHQDAARRFVQFMTLDTAGAVASSRTMNLPPVNKAALPAYLDYLHRIAPAETASLGDLLAVDGARYARHRPTSVGYVQFETTMNKAFTDIRNGGDVATVLGSAQSTLDRQLARQRELTGTH